MQRKRHSASTHLPWLLRHHFLHAVEAEHHHPECSGVRWTSTSGVRRNTKYPGYVIRDSQACLQFQVSPAVGRNTELNPRMEESLDTE
jgi:hypothetical protein